MIRNIQSNRSNVLKFRKLALKLQQAQSRAEWTERDQSNFLRSIKAISQGITSYDRELATYSLAYLDIIFPFDKIDKRYSKEVRLLRVGYVLARKALNNLEVFLGYTKTKDDILSGFDAKYVWLATLAHIIFKFVTFKQPIDIAELMIANPKQNTVGIQKVLETYLSGKNWMTALQNVANGITNKDKMEWTHFYNELINPGTGPLPTRKHLLNILNVFGPSMSDETKKNIKNIFKNTITPLFPAN